MLQSLPLFFSLLVLFVRLRGSIIKDRQTRHYSFNEIFSAFCKSKFCTLMMEIAFSHMSVCLDPQLLFSHMCVISVHFENSKPPPSKEY